MITQKPTKKMLDEWRALWNCYKNSLLPNRKSGAELLNYLQNNYCLTEITDRKMLAVISENVLLNPVFAEKLPAAQQPLPKAFFLENTGSGQKFYLPENQDPPALWGNEITKIFVGTDLSSGFYLVEGSTMLWDELCAIQGIDEKDLENYVVAANYINALKRFGKLDSVIHCYNE